MAKDGNDLLKALSKDQKNHAQWKHAALKRLLPSVLDKARAHESGPCNCRFDCTCGKDLYCRYINGHLQSGEQAKIERIWAKAYNEYSQAVAYQQEVLANLEDAGKAIGRAGKKAAKPFVLIYKAGKWIFKN